MKRAILIVALMFVQSAFGAPQTGGGLPTGTGAPNGGLPGAGSPPPLPGSAAPVPGGSPPPLPGSAAPAVPGASSPPPLPASGAPSLPGGTGVPSVPGGTTPQGLGGSPPPVTGSPPPPGANPSNGAIPNTLPQNTPAISGNDHGNSPDSNGKGGTPDTLPINPPEGGEGGFFCVCRPHHEHYGNHSKHGEKGEHDHKGEQGEHDKDHGKHSHHDHGYVCKCNPSLAEAMNPRGTHGHHHHHGNHTGHGHGEQKSQEKGEDGKSKEGSKEDKSKENMGNPENNGDSGDHGDKGDNGDHGDNGDNKSDSDNGDKDHGDNDSKDKSKEHPDESGPATPPPTGPTPGAPPGVTTSADEVGNTWTWVMCTKPNNKVQNGKPEWEWLLDASGNPMKVNGKWGKAKCKYGDVEPFMVKQETFNNVWNQCFAKAYPIAQPADGIHSNWYPFEFGDQIAGYFYRKSFLTGEFEQEPLSPVGQC